MISFNSRYVILFASSNYVISNEMVLTEKSEYIKFKQVDQFYYMQQWIATVYLSFTHIIHTK